jgi:hypothetical protein
MMAESSTVQAFVAAAISIAGAAVGALIVKWLESGGRLWIGPDRRDVRGLWRGNLQQHDVDPADDLIVKTVEMRFTPYLWTLKGTAYLSGTSKGADFNVDLNLRGGFLDGRFLKVEYTHADRTHVQFGSIVLVLSDNGKTLTGRYAGYGSLTGKIVSGIISLTRETR